MPLGLLGTGLKLGWPGFRSAAGDCQGAWGAGTANSADTAARPAADQPGAFSRRRGTSRRLRSARSKAPDLAYLILPARSMMKFVGTPSSGP